MSARARLFAALPALLDQLNEAERTAAQALAEGEAVLSRIANLKIGAEAARPAPGLEGTSADEADRAPFQSNGAAS